MWYNILTEVERTTQKRKRGKIKMNEYIDYLFTDMRTGEDFLVELSYNPETQPNAIKELYPKAREIAKANFAEPKFLGVYDPDDARMLGLDVY